MSEAIKIFICYKKQLGGASGKATQLPNRGARDLHGALLKFPDRFDPWMDSERIRGGMDWESEIYSRLLLSDVLLLAVTPGTSASEWVKRELALARAIGLEVVPVGYDIGVDQMAEELKALEVGHLQGRVTNNLVRDKEKDLRDELGPDLEHARRRTITAQASILNALASKAKSIAPRKARDQQRALSVEVGLGGRAVRLSVATGDLTSTRNIDILVNSENDYMQMARFFERRTVSSLLRRKGARLTGGRYVDAIQQELDAQLGDRARPVLAADAFVTSAGGPDSRLAAENKVRYIVHVAAVQAVDAEARVVPFSQPYQIEDCVLAGLRKMREINLACGQVSPEGTPQRAHQDALAAAGKGRCSSILFPLFGTGQGGASAVDAIRPMLEGLCRFFDDPDHADFLPDVEEIYLSAFTDPDAEIVKREVQALVLESPPPGRSAGP